MRSEGATVRNEQCPLQGDSRLAECSRRHASLDAGRGVAACSNLASWRLGD
jgi:hypothetical protein